MLLRTTNLVCNDNEVTTVSRKGKGKLLSTINGETNFFKATK